MIRTSPRELTLAYKELYPNEFIHNEASTEEKTFQEIERILSNWIVDYEATPERMVSNSNWYGKVTKALFKAVDIKKPKTVAEMLLVLKSA